MTEPIPSVVDAAFRKFNSESEQVIKAFVDTLNTHEAPETIYHYTNDVGLKGILESGKLWLTDIFNLNDPSELRHGFGRGIDIWNSKGLSGWAEAEGVAAGFEYFYNDAKFRKGAHYFTCSFSADGDELGQWRAYADNGRGYALGFDRQALESALIETGQSPFKQTFPLTYDDNKLTDLQDQIAEKARALINLPVERTLPPAEVNSFKIKRLVYLTAHALSAAVFFKHDAYRNEQEYRFLEMFPAHMPSAVVKVRTRPYSLVRYREFDWRAGASGALKKIVVGPAADREKGPQFARDCLRIYHAGDVEVTQSPIPYRAL